MISKNLLKKTWIDGNVLILGKGYIGKAVAQYLGDEVVKVFHCARADLDYHDFITLTRFILNKDIKYVINCSGFTGRPNVDEAELKKEECWNLNVVVPLNILRASTYCRVKLIHVSSGCIYSGYERAYSEEDTPNFGMYNTESSFYSKTKHAFETLVEDNHLKILRIRMPICNDLTNPRNYLKKILDYPNLINYENSKTYIPELCDFIKALITDPDVKWNNNCNIYNVVNPKPLFTREVVAHLNNMNDGNWKMLTPNWVKLEDLEIMTSRSNCILDNSKADNIFKLSSESTILNMVCNYNNGISAV